MVQSCSLAALVLGAVLVSPVAAQDSTILAGPKVRVSSPASIVERGMDGLVKPAEPNPEVAALSLLDLSESERMSVDAALNRRARLLDAFLKNNLPLLTKLGVAGGTNNKLDQLSLAWEALQQLRPVTELGPLQRQISQHLSPDNASTFNRLLSEYWNAYVKDRRAIKKDDGTYPNRIEIILGAKLESLGRESERALKGMLEGGDLVFQLLFKHIELRPEQREKLGAMVSDFMRETKGDATQSQNAQLFFSVLPVLDESQRPLFLRNVGELAGNKPKNAPRAKAPQRPVK